MLTNPELFQQVEEKSHTLVLSREWLRFNGAIKRRVMIDMVDLPHGIDRRKEEGTFSPLMREAPLFLWLFLFLTFPYH